MNQAEFFDKERGTRAALAHSAGLSDSDKNILAELRHEACESHCRECEACIFDDASYCEDCHHDPAICPCSGCDETRAELRSDGRWN